MIEDRTPQLIVWSLGVTALAIAIHALARAAGLVPAAAAVASLIAMCAIVIGSGLLIYGKRPAPGRPTAGLLSWVTSATAATALCWVIFKLTGSGTFFFGGILLMFAAVLVSLFKNIDEQAKFGAVIGCALAEVMVIMIVLAP